MPHQVGDLAAAAADPGVVRELDDRRRLDQALREVVGNLEFGEVRFCSFLCR